MHDLCEPTVAKCCFFFRFDDSRATLALSLKELVLQ